MLFCPNCANLLLIENDGGQAFYCQSCPYVYSIQSRVSCELFLWKHFSKRSTQHTTRKQLKRKEVDDVLGGADAWKNVDSTEGIWEII